MPPILRKVSPFILLRGITKMKKESSILYSIRNISKVLFVPTKIFQDILRNPDYLSPIIVILLITLLSILHITHDIEEIYARKIMIFSAAAFFILKIIAESVLLFMWANYIKKITVKFSSLFSANSLTVIPLLIFHFIYVITPINISKSEGIFNIGYLINNYLNKLPAFVAFMGSNLTIFNIVEIILKVCLIKVFIKTSLLTGTIILIIYVIIIYYSFFIVAGGLHI